MPDILLHSCCAPCTITVKDFLIDKFGIPDILFYNPNIQPKDEYQKRYLSLKEFCKDNDLKLIAAKEYDFKPFLATMPGLDIQEMIFDQDYFSDPILKKNRCDNCYEIRISETARLASKNNYKAFSTTLLYSIYQDHEKIKELANFYAKKYNLEFIYADFRKSFVDGRKKSFELNLYRQKYCGCIFSLFEKEREKQDNKIKKMQ